MEEPSYHLSGVMRTRDELPADFDGPLDVILLLLSKNKIEIQDVSITSILEQYLAYLDERKRLDMEIASEFIAMASYLMLIFDPQLSLRDVLFEMISAFSTSGLSTGITPQLSAQSRILSIIMMYIGRLGPLTVASLWYFAIGERVRYPEGTIAIG